MDFRNDVAVSSCTLCKQRLEGIIKYFARVVGYTEKKSVAIFSWMWLVTFRVNITHAHLSNLLSPNNTIEIV